MNAKHPEWGARLINPAGRALLRDADAHGYTVEGPDSPTHVLANPHYHADVLDIILHKGLPCPVSTEVLYDMDEQHLPVLITLAFGADYTAPRPQRWRTNWEEFRRACTAMESGPISTAEDVERSEQQLTSSIRAALNSASSPAPQTERRERLPPRLESMRKKKRDLRELWAYSRCPRVKRELNTLVDRVKDEVATWRGDMWDRKIESIAEDPHRTNLHQLNRALTRVRATVCPLRDAAGNRQYRAEDRAELLADHLEEQFRLHPVPNDAAGKVAEHHQMVRDKVKTFLESPMPPLSGSTYISPAEVAKVVLTLNAKKASGKDEVSNAALKRLPAQGLAAMTRLFNGILRTGHFPDTWKEGKVITLPKPGKDKRLPASYRPITLLSAVAKVFERLLLRRLAPYMPPRDEQYGFRAGHSTTLQLTRILHYMAEEMNRGRRVIGVFLDTEKAFDRVWHEGLLFKLMKREIPPALIQVIASFLHGRSFHVQVETAASTTRPIEAGVPQGSCLSPALYGVYTDDIPVLEKEDLREGERGVVLALYADDSAYFTSSVSVKIASRRIQRSLDKLPEWLDLWRMVMNAGKTTAIITGAGRTLPPPLTLRGTEITWESTVKYLGVHIDRTLRMRPQVDHAVQQAKAARALLRPVLTANLPLRTKTGIYKTYIRSRLTYAAPAWYALCSPTQRKRLEVVQNTTLRQITGAGRYVRNDVIARDLKMEPVGEFVARLARQMFVRADGGPHPHLKNIAPQHSRPPEAGQKRALPRDLIKEATPAAQQDQH